MKGLPDYILDVWAMITASLSLNTEWASFIASVSGDTEFHTHASNFSPTFCRMSWLRPRHEQHHNFSPLASLWRVFASKHVFLSLPESRVASQMTPWHEEKRICFKIILGQKNWTYKLNKTFFFFRWKFSYMKTLSKQILHLIQSCGTISAIKNWNFFSIGVFYHFMCTWAINTIFGRLKYKCDWQFSTDRAEFYQNIPIFLKVRFGNREFPDGYNID